MVYSSGLYLTRSVRQFERDFDFLGDCSQFVHYALRILSVCLSDTLVICDHSFKQIELISVSLESPKIVV